MSDIFQNTSQLYRITYEAYSKFANDINRCADLEEVAEVCKTHLKYLLNFRIIRMTIYQGDKLFFFEQFGTKIWFDLREESQLFPYEKELLEKGIPLITNEIPDELIRNKVSLDSLYDPVLWGWCFNKHERKVLVSLLADQKKTFSIGDVEILKLIVDCIQAKFSEIYLKRQLAIQNRNLSEAYDTIKSKNLEIENIVENQKQTIKERTHEIVEKNKKLLHILALNSHSIREPLSRIQGIIQLFEFMDDKECRAELIPKLETTVEEMDEILKEVVDMASKELMELKAKDL
ncbi:histidine kinase [Christiangramia sediminis]|uniref:histidine kinase n=1 Tax=Christiangramia sediminis TaxID=2881336 RepID=A0A9X1RXZ5_9FLAO|nr:histidine kinase [Christiangramia sediminis]MCB7480785.1 histidine kinase [Christiangramia sediminis]